MAPSMKVLIVDDEPEALEQVRLFLGRFKPEFDLLTTSSVNEALDIVEREEVEVIVSDYQMPHINGLDFLRILRKERNIQTPFVMFTGRGREEIAIRALNLGANHYLQKGGDVPSLYELLGQVIQQGANHFRSEREFKINVDRFRKSFEAIPDPAFLVNKEMVIEQVNKRALELLGYDREDIVGLKATDVSFFPPATVDLVQKKWDERTSGSSVDPYLIQVNTKQRTSWVEITAGVFGEDTFEGLIIVARDLTDQLKAEEELRKSDERYRLLFSRMNEGMVVHELVVNADQRPIDYRIVSVNPQFTLITGINAEQAVGKLATEVYRTDEPPYLAVYAKVAQTGESVTFETYFPPMDKHFLISVFAPEIGQFVTVFYDITAQKRNEQELHSLSSMVEQSFEPMVQIDKLFRITYLNQAAENLYGWKKDEVLGKTPKMFVAPHDRDRIIREVRKHLSQGLPYHSEHLSIRKDGSTFYCQFRVSPLVNPEGELIGYMETHRDITSVKEAQSRKDFLSSLLTHDLRNILTNTIGFHVEGKKYRKKVRKLLTSSLELIEKMQTLFEIEEEEISRVQLRATISEVLDQLETNLLRNDIQVHWDKTTCEVLAGPLLDQLFTNLIHNSIKHSNCHNIFIQTHIFDDRVIITVEDDGIGIPADRLETLSTQTLSTENIGTPGLGLTLVKEIAQIYGGSVNFSHSQYGGLLVEVSLPKAQ